MDYKVNGSLLPYVECNLKKGESISAEAGAMLYMNPKIEYKVKSGGIKKMFGRAFTGESMFLSKFTATEDDSKISFSSSFPGEILAVEVTPDKSYIVQKSAYLASEDGVELSTHFQKKLGAGFFGGEGFIMNKLTGKGTAFLEIDGTSIEYNLKADEEIIIATGHLAMMESTCTMDIKSIKGIGNVLFGGEGIFNTVVRGPGKVIMQTMTIGELSARIAPYMAYRGR